MYCPEHSLRQFTTPVNPVLRFAAVSGRTERVPRTVCREAVMSRRGFASAKCERLAHRASRRAMKFLTYSSTGF